MLLCACAVVSLVAIGLWGALDYGLGRLTPDAPTGSGPIVVFRYDDYSNLSSLDIEKALFADFRERGLQLTVAVIPCQAFRTQGSSGWSTPFLRDDKVERLRDGVASGTVDVALHGLIHLPSYRGQGSEFRGLEFTEQLDRIRKGKALLERTCGQKVRVFVPPWNTYDANTKRALEDAGFSCISAQKSKTVLTDGILQHLPRTCGLANVRRAVRQALKAPQHAPIIVAMFHPDSFDESGSEKAAWRYRDFVEFLEWVSQQESIRVMSIGQIVNEGIELGENRLIANLQADAKWAPGFIRRPHKALYYPSDVAPFVGRIVRLEATCFYAIVLSICTAAGMAVSRPIVRHRHVLIRGATWALGVLSIASIAKAATDRPLGSETVLAVVALLGMFIGLVCPPSWRQT